MAEGRRETMSEMAVISEKGERSEREGNCVALLTVWVDWWGGSGLVGKYQYLIININC